EHPHIVPVYGVGCERGVHYYAMKYIEGQSLADLIASQRQSSNSRLSEPRPLGKGEPQPLPNGRGSENTSPVAALTTQRAPPSIQASQQRRIVSVELQDDTPALRPRPLPTLSGQSPNHPVQALDHRGGIMGARAPASEARMEPDDAPAVPVAA